MDFDIGDLNMSIELSGGLIFEVALLPVTAVVSLLPARGLRTCFF